MELIALSALWIFLLLIVVAIVLLIIKRWKIALGLLLLAVAVNWHFQTIPLNLSHDHDADGELKVLSFNCNLSPKDEDFGERCVGVIRLVREQDADVVFLTENFIMREDSLWLKIRDLYPYRSGWKNSVGNRLYSKYPIEIDTLLKDNQMAYGITCCQIDVKGKKVEIIGVHLSSNNYNEQMEYMTPDSVESSEQAKTYLGNIVTASRCRANEASLIVNFIDSISISNKPIPTIVMGDFNDVYGSPTLNTLCKGASRFKDAWWEEGGGYGATIHNPLPYRIDHILYNDRLKLKSIKKIDADKLSDHDALIGWFEVCK